MADISIPSFATCIVKPDERIKVTITDSLWCITSVSINVTDDMPKEGRVVVYISQINEEGKEGEKIAIAPLRVGQCEVVNVDYTINSFSPIIISTSGDKITVSVNGYTTTSEPPTFEKI
ncbi:hypothetical protein GPJ56_010073 [Histomonas meleagridis]|uniref:uncharacterized protein n=1 Tax=Histomonas meleagridis TaxID=135588 RepID=UPI003559A25F|nr:hypothetical protein GPJ56_010073 [Histomonas meleagridis]KAH0805859.1 hypothetical protein GO595_001349 [Histomonas meleagridis]